MTLKNRSKCEILKAFTNIIRYLEKRGLKPQLHRLDNEASATLKEFMIQESIEYQLVPPHIHRQNAAERAIRTFKNHFIAMLVTNSKQFLIHLWDWLVPQATMKMSMMQSSRINPRLLAHE